MPGIITSVANRVSGFLTGRSSRLGQYDALDPGHQRRAPNPYLKHEDHIVTDFKRRQLSGGIRDLGRNFSALAWAIRKHLDYVSSFQFQARTGNDDLDNQIEEFVRQNSKPATFDQREKHDRHRWIRLLEHRRIVDGDVFAIQNSDGRLQAIEAERIVSPSSDQVTVDEQARWLNGIRQNRFGAARQYGVGVRTGNTSQIRYQRSVPAKWVYHHGCFDRFDQVRGISPLTSAYNTIQDLYEGIDYSLAKMKAESLFALVFYREATESAGEIDPEDVNDDGDDKAGYNVKFGRAPVQLDLEPGDRAEFLKSDSPGQNPREFMLVALAIALKALDIPYSFFDESFTNFFGARGAWAHYDRACVQRRREIGNVLDWWTGWKISRAVASGELALPTGMQVDERLWEWIPDGMPWWDPAKEVKADIEAIGAGFTTPQRVVRRRGQGDFFDNVRETARAKEFAEEMGVSVAWGSSSAPAPVPPVISKSPDEPTEDDDDADE